MTGRRRLLLLPVVLLLTAGAAAHLPPILVDANPDGLAMTLSAGGSIPMAHPFFQSLGTNGRACGSCHLPADGWSVTPATAQKRFEETTGLDPLFRPNDAATSPHADVSTPSARRRAYALLLGRGLIRVGLPIPAGADFELMDVDDPYGFASAAELSLFRRPLPATNLRFLSAVMWDGRESADGRTIVGDLMAQANGATVGHAQGAVLDPSVRLAIVDFERGLVSAQVVDRIAGPLDAAGAAGGPRALTNQPFRFAINSVMDQTGTPPTLRVFTLFDSWLMAPGRAGEARHTVALGQSLFNERAFGSRGSTCSGCHNAPNAGSNSMGAFFDVGVSAEAQRAPDVPLYTLRCVSGPQAGRVVRTTDPGWALVTGRCVDIGKFKVPILRGLAARPPYFHDGSAATLADVVSFYDRRFGIGFTPDERAALVAFLRAL